MRSSLGAILATLALLLQGASVIARWVEPAHERQTKTSLTKNTTTPTHAITIAITYSEDQASPHMTTGTERKSEQSPARGISSPRHSGCCLETSLASVTHAAMMRALRVVRRAFRLGAARSLGGSPVRVGASSQPSTRLPPGRTAGDFGSATYCLQEWGEPPEDEADPDDRSEPSDAGLPVDECERGRREARRAGRRNPSWWHDSQSGL
jgi:hypothetical protein